jgi:protein TonB
LGAFEIEGPMFDGIAGTMTRATPRRRGSLAISLIAHLVATAGIVIPTLYVVGAPPELPTMMAFVAPVDTPPPPPPPPPPPAAPAASERSVARASAVAVPIEAPLAIAPEPVFEPTEAGVPGGVEGGIPGGVIGGIVGGISEALPPPPPPPPPARKVPVRVGGQIAEPTVLVKVPPEYPELAARAQIHGVVILEALVDEEGAVQDVRVLRSVKFLDQPAIAALRQWRYTPLLLNGEAQPFVLTVSLTFRLDSAAAR